MLDLVDLGKRSFSAYRGIAPDEQLDEVLQLAERLRGARVLHLNATPYGGGVSESLRSGVALINDLGLVNEWQIIRGDQAFFQVTKRLHNALQGASQGLSESDKATYLAHSQLNASQIAEGYDFIVVHDPQPAALPMVGGLKGARWVWRCHIDTSNPNPEAWEFLRPFLTAYDAAIFTLPEFIPPRFPISRISIQSPAIDPLSPKNLPLPVDLARLILEWIGVRMDLPLVTQISRFDPWKDPLGVIAAYRRVRAHIPNLQLALVGSLAMDDPEGWDIYREIRDATTGDNLIHIFTNLVGVGNIEVNAFQSLSNVIIQKSIREGFGLVVSEALWKGTPVVAGRAGGIPIQMPEGTGGILVDSVEECAEAVLHLLRHPKEAHSLGEQGREHVRRHFLMPRVLRDYLRLMDKMVHEQPLAPRGLALAEHPSASP
ncbi:MAG: glycosyltransferase [Myxococcaceae bacterium]|nr:glycosyltransferase [Myxococcaceae bacterium]